MNRVFVIGLGSRAEAHWEAITACAGLSVAGGFDSSPDVRERWRRRGLPDHENLRAGLAETRPDIILIATPPHAREALVREAAAIHRPAAFFIEKPLALSLEEGRSIASFCEQSGIGLFVTHQLPHAPEFAALLRWVRDGMIGDIKSVRASCFGSLFDQGSHLVDLIGLLLGSLDNRGIVHAAGTDELSLLAEYTDIPVGYRKDERHRGRAWLSASILSPGGAEISLSCGVLAARPRPDLGPWLQKRIVLEGSRGWAAAHSASHAELWTREGRSETVTSSVERYEAALGIWYRDAAASLSSGHSASRAKHDIGTLGVLDAVQQSSTFAAPRFIRAADVSCRDTAMQTVSSPVRVSVILPMKDHRGYAERAVQGWTAAQRCDAESFELIILLSPQTASLESALRKLMRPHDKLLFFSTENEMELYHRGASAASGDILFFTEPHCVAEPQAIEETLRFFEHSDADGFCVRSSPLIVNTISAMESRMYDEGFVEWSKPDHWGKVILRGIVLRKGIYDAVGGFRYSYDRFSEWLLAADLRRRGHVLLYNPAVGVSHLYSHSFRLLDQFIREFTDGEIKFRLEDGGTAFCREFFGEPEEYADILSHDPALNRSALREAGKALVTSPPLSLAQRLTLAGCCIFLGLTEVRGRRSAAFSLFLRAFAAKIATGFPLFTKEFRYRRFLRYWQCTTAYSRVRYVLMHGTAGSQETGMSADSSASEITAPKLANYYGLETWKGSAFRWSKPCSAIRVPPGIRTLSLVMTILKYRGEAIYRRAVFLMNGCPVSPGTVRVTENSIELHFTLTPHETEAGWFFCFSPAWLVARIKNDTRMLGIPVASVRLDPVHGEQACRSV